MFEWILSSSVLIVGILALRRMLRGKISLRLQYALWLVVLVRLLVPVNFFHSNLSIQNMMRPVTAQSVIQQTPDVQEQFPDTNLPQIQQDQPAEVPEDAGIRTPPAENRNEAPILPPAESVKAPVNWTAVAGMIWLAGTVVMLSFTLGCNFQFARMLARNREEIDPAMASIPVYVSNWVKTPCLVGVFRPVIYLTPQVGNDPTVWNHVIRHEMTHLEHFDHVFSLLRCVALCLHWYNPLVWIAARVSKEDAELACDEGTIARLGEGERIGYGETLIRLTCRSKNPSDLMIAATTMIGTHSGIKARILYLAKKPRTLAYALVAGLVAVGLMVGCTFTGAAEEPEEAQIRAFYEEFIEQEQTDPVYALEQYVYIEDETSKTAAFAAAERGEVATSTEILNLEKLSEDLWAVEISYVIPANPEGDTCYNFVGKIDGVYKVMRNVRAIPEELSSGLDLEPYYPTGEYEFIEEVIDEAAMETTVPPETTEPAIPDSYLCLDEAIAGSDITITLEGETIILTEDGLTVTMTTDSRIVKRNFDVTGIMKDVPLIVDGKVYIHGDFFLDFFCKEGTDEVSLFHGALFYVVEVLDALMHPEESDFNRKVAEGACLPGSMGIDIPRLNENRIYLDTPLPQEKYMELKRYGYEGAFTYSEYNLIINSLTLKEAGLSNTDDVTTVGEYRAEHPDLHELMDEEDVAFFEEKQILMEDFWYLYEWFYGGFKMQSDEDLIAALEECYRTDLMFKLEWNYPEN